MTNKNEPLIPILLMVMVVLAVFIVAIVTIRNNTRIQSNANTARDLNRTVEKMILQTQEIGDTLDEIKQQIKIERLKGIDQ